jgi:hypothetical protein
MKTGWAMDDSHNERHAFTLRAIAERCGLPPLRQIAREPKTRAVYRLTVAYHDRRFLDSAATLIHDGPESVSLSLVYESGFGQKPLRHELPKARFMAWEQGLKQHRFDSLRDQPGLPLYGVDLWLLERAAGTFITSVIFAPALADGPHAAVCAFVQTHLPEALRQLK